MGLKEVIEEWKQKPIRELLREMYIDKNMSQHEIARELHIDQGNLSRWLASYGIVKNDDLFTKERKYKYSRRLKDDDEFTEQTRRDRERAYRLSHHDSADKGRDERVKKETEKA